MWKNENLLSIEKNFVKTRVSNSDIKFRNSEIEFQYRFRNSKIVDSDIFEDQTFAKFGQNLGNFGNLSKIYFHGIKFFEM